MAYHRYPFAHVVQHIIADLTHLPNGYRFWYSLSTYRQKQCIRQWNSIILTHVFSDLTRTILLRACLDTQGMVINTALYAWLVQYIYAQSQQELFCDWRRLVQQGEA